MPAPETRHYRYPGPDSFADSDIHRRLFFGREQETSELFHRLLTTRLIALFGKSGLGKTSLLQAGIFPRLREKGFVPLRIRFNNTEHSHPIDAVKSTVGGLCTAQAIDYTEGQGDTLWEFFKTALFSRGDAFLTPFLVLDQFEEIFTLRDAGFRKRLALELGYIINGRVPPSVNQRFRSGNPPSYSSHAPKLPVLISLREDYVGNLQELASEIPSILDDVFRLTPLDRERAYDAIVKPAQLDQQHEGWAFLTPAFRYQPANGEHSGAADQMLDFLQNADGEIEPFQQGWRACNRLCAIFTSVRSMNYPDGGLKKEHGACAKPAC